MRAQGLIFKKRQSRIYRHSIRSRAMHDEMQKRPAWNLLGSWPRWHPVAGTFIRALWSAGGAIHVRGHDMRPVGAEPIDFTVQAQREWDGTGLMLEGEERYIA